MDNKSTEHDARTRAYALLKQTIGELPPGVSLSLQDSDYGRAPLGPGILVPCDNKENTEGPVSYQVAYWLNGVPKGQEGAYFEKTTALWAKSGWNRHDRSDDQWGSYTTPDAFIMLITSAKVDHALALSVTSPCFPRTAGGSSPSEPTRIKQPKASPSA